MCLQKLLSYSEEKENGVHEECVKKGVAAGKRLGKLPFHSNASTVHFARESTAVQLFTTELL